MQTYTPLIQLNRTVGRHPAFSQTAIVFASPLTIIAIAAAIFWIKSEEADFNIVQKALIVLLSGMLGYGIAVLLLFLYIKIVS